MGDSASDDSDMENMEINPDMSIEAVLHFFRYEHGKRFASPVFPSMLTFSVKDGIEKENTFYRPSIPECLLRGLIVSKREANRLENQHRLCYAILKKNL